MLNAKKLYVLSIKSGERINVVLAGGNIKLCHELAEKLGVKESYNDMVKAVRTCEPGDGIEYEVWPGKSVMIHFTLLNERSEGRNLFNISSKITTVPTEFITSNREKPIIN